MQYGSYHTALLDKSQVTTCLSSSDTIMEPLPTHFSRNTRRLTGLHGVSQSGAGAGEDLCFKAVVTEAKGFQAYEDTISFVGRTSWRLSQILRKVIRGLRLDPKHKYNCAIWMDSKGSTSHIEWVKLSNISQLKDQPVPRLRIYRSIRPCNKRKPDEGGEMVSAHQPAVPANAQMELQVMLMLNQMCLVQQYWMMSCMFQGCLPR